MAAQAPRCFLPRRRQRVLKLPTLSHFKRSTGNRMCASSTSLVAVCHVLRDAGTFDFDFGCHLILDERDRLVERRPARMGVTHRDVLEPDRHATEEDEPVPG